jgi:hypothetical protein
MARRIHADDRDGVTDSTFSIPAVGRSSFEASRFERLWTTLFTHRVGPPK